MLLMLLPLVLLAAALTPRSTSVEILVSRPLAANTVAAPNLPTTSAPSPRPAAGRVVSVRTYGAKGDGRSIDRPMIQAAIDAARPGDTLYFPAGTYRLDAPLQVKRGVLTLKGDGATSVLEHGGAEGLILGQNGSEEGLVISRLKFRGLPGRYLADGNTAKAITVNGARGAIIQDCDFEGCGSAVFSVDGPAFGTQILDCRVRGWGEVGFFCNGGERVRRCTLVQNDPNVTGERSSHGFYIHSGAKDVIIADCLIENARKFGLQMYGRATGTSVERIQVLRNTFRNCQKGLIVTSPADGPSFRQIRIEGNRFEGIPNIAVKVQKGDGIVLRGNRFDRCDDGIMLAEWPAGATGDALQNVLVEDNHISNCHGGIWVSVQNGSSLPNTLIRNNVITDCRVTVAGSVHTPGVRILP